MPNWTSCSLIIRGNKEQLDKIEKTKLDFNNIIPMPKELQLDTSDTCASCGDKISKTVEHCKKCDIFGNIGGRSFDQLNENEKKLTRKWISKYGTYSWYDWCVTHWGVKWDASELEISRESPTMLNVYFATPWSVPTPIIKKLSEQCSEIFVHVDEEGGESYEFKIIDRKITETRYVTSNNDTMYLGGAPSRKDVLKI